MRRRISTAIAVTTAAIAASVTTGVASTTTTLRIALVGTPTLSLALLARLALMVLRGSRAEIWVLSASRLVGAIGINLVARRETDFQFDNLIPLRVSAFPFRNGEQFTQALTKLVSLRIHLYPS